MEVICYVCNKKYTSVKVTELRTMRWLEDKNASEAPLWQPAARNAL